MKDKAQIRIYDATTDLRLVWDGFDGDDCFSHFFVDVTSGHSTRRFCLGPCAVRGLRKLSGFFRTGSQGRVSLGFRHPDVRYCDLVRNDNDLRLLVRFEGSGLSEQFCVEKPSVQLEDDFLAEY